MQTFFEVLILIASLAVIISVTLQQGEEGGMAALTGGSQESLFGKNKSKSKDAALQRITVISSVIFMISAVALAAI